MSQCLELYINPVDEFLKNLGKNVHEKNLGKNVYIFRPPDIHYPGHPTSERFPSWNKPEAKNAGLIFSRMYFITIRIFNFILFFGTFWMLPGSFSKFANLKMIE